MFFCCLVTYMSTWNWHSTTFDSRCSVLQCVAVCCSVLQPLTVLQHTATTHCNILQTDTRPPLTVTSVLQPLTVLQHTATHCNTLQHTATHCNILQTDTWPPYRARLARFYFEYLYRYVRTPTHFPFDLHVCLKLTLGHLWQYTPYTPYAISFSNV